MSPDPFKNLDPMQTVKVLPRHLAGPGPIDPRSVWEFPSEEVWPFHQAEDGTAASFSPCLRLWTVFDPQPDKFGKGTWSIGANRVPHGPTVWRITFDDTIPVELLDDVHTELLDLYLEEQDSHRGVLFEDETPPYEAYTPLLAHGWNHEVKTNGTQTFRSPDGLGGMQHWYATGRSVDPAWAAWAGDPSEPLWAARFSVGTPASLVAAFTASLISTEPLHRTVKDVPFHTRHRLYMATATAKQPPDHSPAAPPPAGPTPGRSK